MKPQYSWSELIKTSSVSDEVSSEKRAIADDIIDLLRQASTEDRQQILRLYSSLFGKEYSEDMIAKADIDVFKEIYSSWNEDDLRTQYDLLSAGLKQTASKDDEDEDDEDEDNEMDDDNGQDADKEGCYASSAGSEVFNRLVNIIASWSHEDQKAVHDEWLGLLGKEYTGFMTKDYIPKGKARDVSKPQSSGQTEASSSDNVKTASKKDRNEIASLFRGLWGNNFVSKLTELYSTGNGKTVSQSDQTSGQTKTSSYDPWGLKKKLQI